MRALAIAFVSALPLVSSGPSGEELASAAPPTPEISRAIFERFRGMSGTWVGKSTKGWEETLRYEVIAGGSTVLETSVNAHPDQTMATAFHMDGDRLMLTHYCMAKNQPRLAATGFADGGRTVVFTFLDGGNLPTRDKGHMDKAVFTFEAPGRVTSRWTWYENGKEKWFEEIVQTRRP